MERIRAYWKRFAALATAFANKYQADQFFRTETVVVGLQVGFVLILLAVMLVSFRYLQADVSSTLISGITQELSTSHAPIDLLSQVEAVQTRSLATVSIIIILVTLGFGFILARLTLIPTRNALSAQKQFVGNIAHELRTPLSILKTNTEVALLDKNVEPGMQRMFLSNIEELDRISHIIDNLLTLSTFVRPERIEFANVDLGTVVDTVTDKLSLLAHERNVKLDVRKAEFRLVWGNATALEQMVMNLVKNAINYNKPGGLVSVTVEPNYAGMIELTIKDTGIGIYRKDLFRIFEPFYRAEQSRSRERGGSGLGLAIVSELLKLHHGKISIQSVFKQGTTVSVLLPAGKRVAQATTEDKNEGPERDFGEIKVDFS